MKPNLYTLLYERDEAMRDNLIQEETIKENIDLEFIKKLKFDEKGLIPTIVQDINTKEVLMLAYMNETSIEKTIKEKKACYFSRSRQQLWTKGETSGNIQRVVGLSYDCDNDTILLEVEQKGVACHTGNYSCFFNEVFKDSIINEQKLINKLYDLKLYSYKIS